MRKTNPLFHGTSMRPYLIDYAEHDDIKGYIPNQGLVRSAALSVIGPVIRAAVKSQWSPTRPLGRFLTEMAMGKWDNHFHGEGIEKLGDFTIVENVAFRRLAGLDGAA